MKVGRIAAVTYTIISAGVVAFQLALALGMPWGAYAMGGTFPGQFPPALRVAAVIQAVVLALMAGVVLARAGLALPGWSRVSNWLIWVIVIFLGLSVLLNFISPSGGERMIWTPVAALLLLCSLSVAMGSSRVLRQ
jgi:hypothetical protein